MLNIKKHLHIFRGDQGKHASPWNFQKIVTSLLINLFTVCKLPLVAEPHLLQWWTSSQCVWWHFELVSDRLETEFSTCFSTLGFFFSLILKWIFCRLSNEYCTYFINKWISKFDSSCVNAFFFYLNCSLGANRLHAHGV